MCGTVASAFAIENFFQFLRNRFPYVSFYLWSWEGGTQTELRALPFGGRLQARRGRALILFIFAERFINEEATHLEKSLEAQSIAAIFDYKKRMGR